MAMVSAVQEAQKDNLRSFNDYMMKVLEVSVILSFILYYLESLLCVTQITINKVIIDGMFIDRAQSSYCLVEFNLWQEDWQKEKRDFLQSLSRISTLPKMNITDTSNVSTRPGHIVSVASSPQVSSGTRGMEVVPLASKPIVEKKASVYAEVVKVLNKARECGLPFKVRAPLSLTLFNLE